MRLESLIAPVLGAVAAGPHPQMGRIPEKSHQIYPGKRVNDFLKPWIEPYYECVNRQYVRTGTMCGRSSNYEPRIEADCIAGRLEGRSPFSKYSAWKDENYKNIKYNRDYSSVDSFLLPPQVEGYPTIRIKAFEATFMSTNEFDFSQEFFGITAIARAGRNGHWNIDNDGIIKLNMFPKRVKNAFFAMIEEKIQLNNTILLTFEYKPSTERGVEDLCDWTFHQGSQEHDFFTIYAERSEKMINLLKYSINSWLADDRPDTLLSDIYSSRQKSTLELFPNTFVRESTAETRDAECLMKEDPLGKDYRGTMSVGKRGAKCLPWSALDDNDSNGPWCFVKVSPERQFQYCQISACEEEETAAGMSSPPAPMKTSYKETLQIAKEKTQSENGAGFSENAKYNVNQDGTRERYFADITLSPSSTEIPPLESTEKMESLRQKYLNHAMNYNPPTWRPPVTAGSKSTQGSTTTRRTTTRTSPRPRPTSALTTRRKPVQWTRYNWTNSPTTVTTTTRMRTTKRTTKPTTTTRIDENYDDFYGDSSGAPATPSDCFDFYFYNDDGVQLTQEECLAVVQGNK
ncbi:Oidioi.mRNA.OKI2018_I69.chr2.g8432.t1.cds [Oikopleura dioica]|uniref:Oidioi.mRNA.OKI2018_I69.chr2.g8432.t1.cds n=1 Tax=Oikopleura dioica TaxID=34765 RepID=A0ABN7TCF0_OIKDI|nr:Oidioi.mRNA.OKI2018_I69.chr2.g8432.t1.cds [Oikopleura dioica]